LNDKGETPDQALLSAMAEKQAKMMRDMEAKALKDSFNEALLSDEPSQAPLQPKQPAGDKPELSRPAPRTAEGTVEAPANTESQDEVSDLQCSPARKLDFAQRLDAQLGRAHTTSRLITSEKAAPSGDVQAKVCDTNLRMLWASLSYIYTYLFH
jgi:hypothetical protein